MSARPFALARTHAALVALPVLLSVVTLSAPASAQSADVARVTVRTEEPDLVVGEVKERAIATSGGHVASGVSWDDKCTAPCSFELKPGVRELVFQSESLLRFERLRLKPGQNDVYVDPGSRPMRLVGTTLAVLGLVATITGGAVLLARSLTPSSGDGESDSNIKDKTSWAMPVMLGGIAGLGGGITLAYLGRVKVEEGTGPAATARGAAPPPPAPSSAGVMVRWQGSF